MPKFCIKNPLQGIGKEMCSRQDASPILGVPTGTYNTVGHCKICLSNSGWILPHFIVPDFYFFCVLILFTLLSPILHLSFYILSLCSLSIHNRLHLNAKKVRCNSILDQHLLIFFIHHILYLSFLNQSKTDSIRMQKSMAEVGKAFLVAYFNWKLQ